MRRDDTVSQPQLVASNSHVLLAESRLLFGFSISEVVVRNAALGAGRRGSAGRRVKAPPRLRSDHTERGDIAARAARIAAYRIQTWMTVTVAAARRATRHDTDPVAGMDPPDNRIEGKGPNAAGIIISLF